MKRCGRPAPELQAHRAPQLSAKFPGSTLDETLIVYPVATGGNELAMRPEVLRHQFAPDVPAAEGR